MQTKIGHETEGETQNHGRDRSFQHCQRKLQMHNIRDLQTTLSFLTPEWN